MAVGRTSQGGRKPHLVGCLCVGYGSEGASEPVATFFPLDLSFPSFPPDLFVPVALPVAPFGFGFAFGFPAGEEVLEAALIRVGAADDEDLRVGLDAAGRDAAAAPFDLLEDTMLRQETPFRAFLL